MGWGLGGVSRQAGLLLLQGHPPPQAWRPLPLGGPGCGQPSQGLGWARPGQQSLLGPGCAATLARGEDAFPLPSGAASPFPPTISGSGSVNLTVAMATPASRQLLAASGRRALPCQGLGGRREGGGRDLRRATWGQRPGEGWLSNIRDWHPGGARGRSPRFRPLTSAVSSLGPGVMRGAWAWGQRSKVRGQSREPGHRGPKPESSPLRRAPSSSGFLVTDTTFMTRRFPPWRIRATTCLCPTFTTFTPFTWDSQGPGAVQVSPPRARRPAPHGAAQGRTSLTSIRKSPVRSPALQATPSTSTDSRY